jgi:CBS-domain-containing membrane protein
MRIPILAGTTLMERLLACLGALVGIMLTGLICGVAFGDGPQLPLIVTPMVRLRCFFLPFLPVRWRNPGLS